MNASLLPQLIPILEHASIHGGQMHLVVPFVAALCGQTVEAFWDKVVRKHITLGHKAIIEKHMSDFKALNYHQQFRMVCDRKMTQLTADEFKDQFLGGIVHVREKDLRDTFFIGQSVGYPMFAGALIHGMDDGGPFMTVVIYTADTVEGFLQTMDRGYAEYRHIIMPLVLAELQVKDSDIKEGSDAPRHGGGYVS